MSRVRRYLPPVPRRKTVPPSDASRAGAPVRLLVAGTCGATKEAGTVTASQAPLSPHEAASTFRDGLRRSVRRGDASTEGVGDLAIVVTGRRAGETSGSVHKRAVQKNAPFPKGTAPPVSGDGGS